MKITYTSPNRSHHYPYAAAMHRAGHLSAFICGFSRLSPRSDFPEIGTALKRHDFYQTLFLLSLKIPSLRPWGYRLQHRSNVRLDHASYKWAKDTDAFIFYRTQGLRTTRRLRKEGRQVLCIMEEVNSHVEYAQEILKTEFDSLNLNTGFKPEYDYDLRMETYQEADCILCPSEFVRRSFLSKGFRPERLIKVNFGFPSIEELAVPKTFSADDMFRVLYVGQLHYRKGLRYAIEAFRKLKHPKKEFVIVGPATEVTGLEKTQIPEGVVFTGILKGEALKNQYRTASVFILPSLEEGLALVQGEALAFGVPILITTNTGGDDIINDGVEGFIVPPADVKSLSERLQEMADNHDKLNEMSENALHAAKQLGNWDTAVVKLVNAINNSRKNEFRPEDLAI